MLAWLKRLGTRLPYPLFLRLYIQKRRWFETPGYRKARLRSQLPLLDTIDLREHKKSDTLFILGSGPSINSISEERWRGIAQHDSIGFNFWICHRFVPTYFVYEKPEASPPEIYSAFVRMASARADEYRSVPKIVTELRANRREKPGETPPAWNENLFTVYPITPAARTEAEFAYALSLLKRRGAFPATGRFSHLFKYASTLSSLVALAFQMQYRNIVLCGIDLRTQEYFYQDPVLYPETCHLVPEPKALPHLTVRHFEWLVKMDVVLRQMRRQLLEPAGINIYIENRGSILWPEISEAPPELFAVSE